MQRGKVVSDLNMVESCRRYMHVRLYLQIIEFWMKIVMDNKEKDIKYFRLVSINKRY